MMPLVSRANFDKKKNVVSKSYDVTGKIKYAVGKSYDALGKPDHLRYTEYALGKSYDALGMSGQL